MSKKADVIIAAIEAMIKETQSIVFIEEKMVSSSHSIKVRTKALRDVIRVIEDYVEEGNANSEAYRKGELG